MTSEQMVQAIQDLKQENTMIKTKQNNDHTRIEEIKGLATQIHKLAASVEHLAEQTREQNVRIEKFIEAFDARLGKQGERIGSLETVAERRAVVLEKHQKRIEGLEKDVDELKTKGSRRWDGAVEKVICVVIGAVIMTVLYSIGF